MANSSLLWLRVAALLYAFGLVHAALWLTRQRDSFFRVSFGAFAVGSLFHLVSIAEQGLQQGHFPVSDIFQTISLCAFLIAASFLFVYWRYHAASLSVFIFPLVFVLAVVAGLSNSFPGWNSPNVRSASLIAHIVFILIGYAALLFTAVAAVAYLFQEQQLKNKSPHGLALRLPPLGTLDELISSSLSLGFVAITIGTVIGAVWAFVEFGIRWIADPRIGISFVTWGIYLALVFFRVTAGWRGRKAAILAIAALCCSVVTWITHVGILAG